MFLQYLATYDLIHLYYLAILDVNYNWSYVAMYVAIILLYKLGECMVLWGEPNEPSIQHQLYIFRQCVDS